MASNRKRVAVIGGGTGIFAVLKGLKKYPVDLSAIVTMADDGGSTGILRQEFGILPPGDVRRALIALSGADEALLARLFNYRFADGSFRGHPFGNIMLTALEQLTGSFEAAIDEAAKILGAKGQVIPVTLDRTRLCAELEDGSVIKGETNIDIPKHNGSLKIRRVYLEPPCAANPKASEAIAQADLIIIGPGDLFTSIIPNFLVDGISEALHRSKGKKVYVCNLMTKWGETNGFKVHNFIETLEKYLGKAVLTHIVYNTKLPEEERLEFYRKEKASAVIFESGRLPPNIKQIAADVIDSGTLIRHSPHKLSQILLSIIGG